MEQELSELGESICTIQLKGRKRERSWSCLPGLARNRQMAVGAELRNTRVGGSAEGRKSDSTNVLPFPSDNDGFDKCDQSI